MVKQTIGPVGFGRLVRLINNLVAMGYAGVYAETPAHEPGLAPWQFHAVIGSSRMRNGFYDTFMHWTLEGARRMPVPAHYLMRLDGLESRSRERNTP